MSEIKELFSNRKTVISLIIVIILILGLAIGLYLIKNPQIFKSRATEKKGNTTLENAKFQGYIIEFKDAPAIEKSKGMNKFFPTEISGKGKISPQSVEDYSQNTLKPAHDTAKRDIFERLRTPSPQGFPTREPTILGEYFNTFNGIALDITVEQAEKVKKSPFVKAVYPNLEVKANLNQSVPLINGDKAWLLKDSSGKNITGEGVNIAVLDTGVDYTHSNLGASQVVERNFEQVNSDALEVESPFDKDHDQIFAVNNGRVAYFANKQINIYTFATKTTTKIDTLTPNLSVKKIAMKDDDLAYYAVSSSLPAVYYYNLRTGAHQKVVDTFKLVGDINYGLIGSIAVAEGKVIYAKCDDNISNCEDSTYAYDLTTKTESRIIGSNSLFKVWGDLVAASIYGASCYEKMILYNIKTGQSRSVFPPGLGSIIDFKGGKVLYSPCGSNFDGSSYYLYDIDTGNYTELRYSTGLTGQDSVIKKLAWNVIWTVFNSYKGFIGDGVVYFSKDNSATKIVAYDQIQGRYIQVNLLKNSGAVDGEGKKVCFVASDLHIYCHNYDPNNAYEVVTNIFNNKVVGGYNFVASNNDPFDDNGHGTHVSAIAAGTTLSTPLGMLGGGYTPTPTPTPLISPNSLIGVAPGAKITAFKVLDSEGNGTFADILAAIEQSVGSRLDNDPQNNIDIISMSLGVDCKRYYGDYTRECGPDDPQSKAVDNAVNAGIVVVVAAGNNGSSASTVNSPGTARKAITVGAVDKNKQIASFSSRGPVVYNGETINKPDIVAPGVSICAAEYDGYHSESRCVDDKHVAVSGTSMAAPHVAGLAALLKQAHPEWTPLQIKNAIVSTADSLGLPATTQGAGLVNAMAALSAPVATPSSSPSPSPTPFVCTACAADIVKSVRNRVDAQDNALLSSCFGKSPSESLPGGKACTSADINKDGSINQTDVDCLRSVYFQTCAATGSATQR